MTATIGEARRDELAGRLAGAVLATLDLQAVYVGDRLGLYRALEDGGPATAPELAARSGIHPRYAREWLERRDAPNPFRSYPRDTVPTRR